MQTIQSLEEFNSKLSESAGNLFYFSHEKCNVCKVLKPKIYNLLKNEYPKLKMFYCDTEYYPEIAGQNSVFTVPTILVFFDGKEFFRKSRNIGIDELSSILDRPYSIFFD
ncbi:MAG: thioredoxin [Marinilabiliales bacterium]|nr:MAG: thioredoxin [Marinilabiliales bacterium]